MDVYPSGALPGNAPTSAVRHDSAFWRRGYGPRSRSPAASRINSAVPSCKPKADQPVEAHPGELRKQAAHLNARAAASMSSFGCPSPHHRDQPRTGQGGTVIPSAAMSAPQRGGSGRGACEHGLMGPDVNQLADPRRGHFDLGTGFHGDLWLDLDAMFLRPVLLRPLAQLVARQLDRYRPAAGLRAADRRGIPGADGGRGTRCRVRAGLPRPG